jgi:hypothetical protein
MAAPEAVTVSPRARDHAAGRDEILPPVDPLPNSSFVPIGDRLCILLLSTLVVFVPVLTIKTSPTRVMRDIVIGVSYTLPTTLLVLNADKSAHTKWFWGECAVVVVCVIYNHLTMTLLPDKSPRLVAFLGLAMAITLPLLRISCRGSASRDERRRIFRLIAAAWGQLALYLVSEGIMGLFFFNPSWTASNGLYVVMSGPILCAGFVVRMLHLDRKEVIEHSVVYAVAYSWALHFSVLGSSYFLRMLRVMFSFNPQYVLIVQIFLSLFGSVMLWIFSRISRRITTMRDEVVYMFPGFFALVEYT